MSGLTGTPYRTNLVHMENNIQKARDVLAKWRDLATGGSWTLLWDWATFNSPDSDDANGYVGDTVRPGDARLIVGTAGNPELLDAIDRVLEDGAADDVTRWGDHSAYHAASGLAAAIIAADERMSA